MLEQIAETIQGLLSPVVSKCFVGDFPSLGAEGVSIKLYEGEELDKYFGSTPTTPTVTLYKAKVLLTARGVDYAITLDWLSDIRATVDGYRCSSLGITLLAPPSYIGRDDQKLHEFQVTYKTLIKE